MNKFLVKMNGKIRVSDVLYILFILFCLLFISANVFVSWWYFLNFAYTLKQFFISSLLTFAMIVFYYVTFTEIFVITIKRK